MRIDLIRKIVFVLAAVAAVDIVGVCYAQEPSLVAVGHNSNQVVSGLKLIAEQVKQSIVEIHDEQQYLCLGTIVSKDGLIVTKASELGDTDLNCHLHNGAVAKMKLIGSSEQDDLALLQIERDDLVDEQGNRFELKPVTFETLPELKQGSFVVSIDSKSNTPLIGIITVEDHGALIKSPECTDCIDVGLECSPTMLPQLQQQGNQWSTIYIPCLRVERVHPRSIAEQCEFMAGDVIEKINGRTVSSQSDLVELSKSLRPGDLLTFVAHRNGQRTELSRSISRHSKTIFHDHWGGGPFSRRRFGFPDVLTHDIPIHPDQCGGPIVDLKGRTVGINVARSLRVATLVIPIENVKKFIVSLRPDADLIVLWPRSGFSKLGFSKLDFRGRCCER